MFEAENGVAVFVGLDGPGFDVVFQRNAGRLEKDVWKLWVSGEVAWRSAADIYDLVVMPRLWNRAPSWVYTAGLLSRAALQDAIEYVLNLKGEAVA